MIFGPEVKNNTIARKHKSKHELPCHSPDLNPGPLARHSGVLPLVYQDD